MRTGLESLYYVICNRRIFSDVTNATLVINSTTSADCAVEVLEILILNYHRLLDIRLDNIGIS